MRRVTTGSRGRSPPGVTWSGRRGSRSPWPARSCGYCSRSLDPRRPNDTLPNFFPPKTLNDVEQRKRPSKSMATLCRDRGTFGHDVRESFPCKLIPPKLSARHRWFVTSRSTPLAPHHQCDLRGPLPRCENADCRLTVGGSAGWRQGCLRVV